MASAPEVMDQRNQTYGLQIMSSKSTSNNGQTETEKVVEQVKTTEDVQKESEKTIEEQALDALIRGMHFFLEIFVKVSSSPTLHLLFRCKKQS